MGPVHITHLSGVNITARGRTWCELATNVLEQLDVVASQEGTTLTLTRAPRSWRRWHLRRDQILIGALHRRWDRTWDCFDPDGQLLVSGAVSRQDAMRALLDHARPGR